MSGKLAIEARPEPASSDSTPDPLSHAVGVALSPHGALRLEEADGHAALDTGNTSRLGQAFARGAGDGLLALALAGDLSFSPDLAFWRNFANCFVAARCQSEAGKTPCPAPDDLAALIDEAPPMRGGEYLDVQLLTELWLSLQNALEADLARAGLELDGYLARHDSRWRHVGRVHFNLAENRKDAGKPFAFLATYVPGIGEGTTLRHAPLGGALREFAGTGAKPQLLKLLEPVARASENCPWLGALVDTGEIFHPLRWTPAEALRLLADSAVLEQAGIILRMPASWPGRRPSRPMVEAVVGSAEPSKVGAAQLLDFSVAVVLDGETLTPAEIDELLAAGNGLAMLRGKWVEIDQDRLTAALDRYGQIAQLAKTEGLSFGQAMRLLAGAGIGAGGEEGRDDAALPTVEWGRVTAGTWFAETLAQCRTPDTLAGALPGGALRAELRPYQETGVRWLSFLTRLGLGACLADDMGLGKTLQVLALALASRCDTKSHRPHLVVAPASLLANWAGEAGRFAPDLRVFVAHPAFASREELTGPEPCLAETDLVITSYGSLLRLDWLAQMQWHLVIIDEAQAIKNANTKQARAVKALRADGRIALTGTPVENNLGDLWSIFDFLNPGLLGSARAFRSFAKGLAAEHPPNYAPLRRLVAPYILRRMKTDRRVIADLPDKTEVKAWCALSRGQAALYQRTVDDFERLLEDAGDDMSRRGLVLSTLMRLKQICNHASHGAGGTEWSRAGSGKFERLAEIAATVASRQEKMLVFTQFAEAIKPLCSLLAGVFGKEGLALSGDTAVGRRKGLVARFQEDETVPFFVLSLKAGGSGLTLTAASHVVHFDRWWNPAVENQATDRAFRIGQKRNVLVHKFVCRGTIEERIDEMIEAKQQMAAQLLAGGGEINLTELGDRDLLDLVRLDLSNAVDAAA
ncbi:DEAD/DEAH box helicase [Sphingobium ummariense]